VEEDDDDNDDDDNNVDNNPRCSLPNCTYNDLDYSYYVSSKKQTPFANGIGWEVASLQPSEYLASSKNLTTSHCTD